MKFKINDASQAGSFAAHAALLTWLHAQSGASQWDVTREQFGESLQRSASHRFGGDPPSGEALELYLRGLHVEDLALACALRNGSNAAWEEFVLRYRPVLRGAARAIVGAGGEARACELADSLFAELYGLERDGRQRKTSLLDYFHGRSKLATWLRAVLAQRHVDALRTASRAEPFDDEPGSDERTTIGSSNGASDGADPDRARLLPRLHQALKLAFAALSASDRLLLSLYYLQNLTLAQIAAVRAVHEATVSRQLDRVRRELRDGVERALTAGQASLNGAGVTPLSPPEVQLCLSYALEDWPFDLGRALAGRGADGKQAV
jgi:RNA polymerase sigma-70 factor